MSKPFAAIYAGKCADCAEWFKPGTAIRYDDLGQIVHAECEGNTDADPLATNAPVCERCWITKPCDCEDDT